MQDVPWFPWSAGLKLEVHVFMQLFNIRPYLKDKELLFACIKLNFKHLVMSVMLFVFYLHDDTNQGHFDPNIKYVE